MVHCVDSTMGIVLFCKHLIIMRLFIDVNDLVAGLFCSGVVTLSCVVEISKVCFRYKPRYAHCRTLARPCFVQSSNTDGLIRNG